jgi:hypothetical protein
MKKIKTHMQGFIQLTMTADKGDIRLNPAFITSYRTRGSATLVEFIGNSGSIMHSSASVAVTETPEEIDLLISKSADSFRKLQPL